MRPGCGRARCPSLRVCLAPGGRYGNRPAHVARSGSPRYERRVPFLSHAGVSLRYDRVGTGPLVLLVHGWTGNRTFWDRQVQALRDRFTLVTVDLRGHGESSHPRTGYTIGAMAGDLEHLVRALDADLRPHLRTLDVPTAVLLGRHDGLLPLAGGEVLAKGIRGARLTVFEDSAHAPFLEEPDTFNAALSELLAR